mmetsp:Transcript_42156/g.67770  ORF Transcript_42156/g.67770 Transcript_42156/m.67770 type:complete len:215 (+) Transcript_42156:491-1135(+)
MHNRQPLSRFQPFFVPVAPNVQTLFQQIVSPQQNNPDLRDDAHNIQVIACVVIVDLGGIRVDHWYNQARRFKVEHKTRHEYQSLVSIQGDEIYPQPLRCLVNPSISFQRIHQYICFEFCIWARRREKNEKSFFVWIQHFGAARLESLIFVLVCVDKCSEGFTIFASVNARSVNAVTKLVVALSSKFSHVPTIVVPTAPVKCIRSIHAGRHPALN